MKSITAVTIPGTFAVTALVYSVACEEMGFEMKDSGIVEVQEELSTCVCRVDGDIENPGDGKTWETACRTVDDCVERVEADEDGGTRENCVILIKKGSEALHEEVDLAATEILRRSKIKTLFVDPGESVFLKKSRNSSRKPALSLNDSRRDFSTVKKQVSQRLTPRFNPVEVPEPQVLDTNCIDCNGGSDLTIDDDLIVTDDAFISGSLGINTTSPSKRIHIVGTYSPEIRIDSGNGYNSTIQFVENGNNRWQIMNQGSNDNFVLYHYSPNQNVLWVDYDAEDGFTMTFDGKMEAEEIEVKTVSADFVFDSDYKLPSLESVEEHISKHGHLPEIPPAKEIRENGIGLGEASRLLLQKVEELTLYAIEQKKEIDALKQEVRNLKKNHGATSYH